jgi:hypothetical protein
MKLVASADGQMTKENRYNTETEKNDDKEDRRCVLGIAIACCRLTLHSGFYLDCGYARWIVETITIYIYIYIYITQYTTHSHSPSLPPLPLPPPWTMDKHTGNGPTATAAAFFYVCHLSPFQLLAELVKIILNVRPVCQHRDQQQHTTHGQHTP